MTGKWEQRLHDIAVGGRDWKMPAADQLTQTLTDLQSVLKKAASDPGFSGKTGLAASDSLERASQRADQIVQTTKHIQKAIDRANEVRGRAGTDLIQLPSGTMSPALEAKVRAAEPGDVIDTGYACILVDENTLANMQEYYAAQRETAAKAAVERATRDYDNTTLPEELVDPSTTVDDRTRTGPGGGGGYGGSGGGGYGSYGGGSGGSDAGASTVPSRSFMKYPDWDDDPLGDSTAADGVFVPEGRPGPGDPGFVGFDQGGDGDVIVSRSPWSDGGLTPNGAATGGTTFAGPSTGAGGLVGGSAAISGAGSVGGGSGSFSAGSGAMVAGSAAALAAGGRLTGGFTSPGGAGGASAGAAGGASAGAATAGGASAGGLAGGGRAVSPGGMAGGMRSGGLLGGARPAAGSAGTGGAAAGGRRAAQAGGTTSGARPSERAAAGGRAGEGAGAGGRGSTGMIGGGAGGRGAASEKSRRSSHGLGGPIAERIDEDSEHGPRSAAAGAGGRA